MRSPILLRLVTRDIGIGFEGPFDRACQQLRRGIAWRMGTCGETDSETRFAATIDAKRV
jgi:hypothetical protein